MKKIMMIAALALFTFSANAQTDKEATKALKEAKKNAEKLVKKAKSEYEMSIPNANYGRKETDYTKLDGAVTLIEQALADQNNSDNSECFKTAVDIYSQYYNKYNTAIKANSDDADAKASLLKIAEKIAPCCVKWEEIESANPKKKENEYKLVHQQLQVAAINSGISFIQNAQNFSSSDKQDELKHCVSLCDNALKLFQSGIVSDYNDQNAVKQWIVYSKAFKAQSLASIEDANASDVESAYNSLIGTEFESISYNALCNYFRERNTDKYVEYLQKGMEKADAETFPNFAFMLMQHQFQNDKKDACLETIQIIKEKCPDNENTINAYLMEGQIYFERKAFDKAEALFAEAVAKFPNDDRAITMPAKSAWMKAQNSGEKKDMQHAIDLFLKLQKDYPNESEYWGEPLYILYNNINNLTARDKYKKYYNVK